MMSPFFLNGEFACPQFTNFVSHSLVALMTFLKTTVSGIKFSEVEIQVILK
jgi:hypothetical protein